MILALGKGKQTAQKFKIIFSYVRSLKPVWTTGDCQKKKKKKGKTDKEGRRQASI